MGEIGIAVLEATDEDALDRVAPGVFDGAIRPDRLREFLRDPRHHLVVARDGQVVVGMASGVHYVHPDKEPELWINEVAVAPSHRGRGIGTRLVRALLDRGRALGCREAWVLTDRENEAALRLYAACGGGVPEDQAMVSFDLT